MLFWFCSWASLVICIGIIVDNFLVCVISCGGSSMQLLLLSHWISGCICCMGR